MAKVVPNDNRYSPQPDRSYQCPGGPYAEKLGETTVKVLAEVERGGDGDNGVEGGRDLDDRHD
jgi:hypothetical protein